MSTQGPAAAPNGGGSAVKAAVKLDIGAAHGGPAGRVASALARLEGSATRLLRHSQTSPDDTPRR
jgi:hypothetical protein